MDYTTYNDGCMACPAPGPVVRVPHALPPKERPGFISRFYSKVNWLQTAAGLLCPTCKAKANVAS